MRKLKFYLFFTVSVTILNVLTNTARAAEAGWCPCQNQDYLVVSDKQGFDKCEAPTIPQLQTWWTSSPYWDVNIYIGGANRGCANSGLNAAWITSATAQGWDFIPTWVGPQAPCRGFSSSISYDIATANNQGRSEADAAMAQMSNLGLTVGTGGSIVYYDIENYDTSNTACRNAVNSFLSGWNGRMRELGNRSGIYGSSCGSAASDWASLANVPDDVWLAHWYKSNYDPAATVWGISCVSDALWASQQRIRQYAGDHTGTWGGLTFSIDSDISDGHLAGTNQHGTTKTTLAMDEPEQARSMIIKMRLMNETQGWAWMSQSVVWTNDGGATWFDILPQGVAGADVQSVFFLDPLQGWLAASSPDSPLVVFQTRDGARTWESLPVPSFVSNAESLWISKVNLDFIDSATGWMAIKLASSSNFSIGRLLGTEDGGQTWKELTIPIGDPVRFIDPMNGWTAGGAGGNKLFRTMDGGQTWHDQSSLFKFPKTGQIFTELPFFQDKNHGVMPVTYAAPEGSKLQLYLTMNGGQTWQEGPSAPIYSNVQPGTKSIFGFAKPDKWIAGLPGNAGLLSFEQVEGAPMRIDHSTALPTTMEANSTAIIDISFVSGEFGWVQTACGACAGAKSQNCKVYSQLFKTMDGGGSWLDITP